MYGTRRDCAGRIHSLCRPLCCESAFFAVQAALCAVQSAPNYIAEHVRIQVAHMDMFVI